MASLELDIKQNDSFAKSAYAAADALDYVAAKEQKVNALASKIGKSFEEYGSTLNYGARSSTGAGTSKTESAVTDKQNKAEKKKTDEQKKQKEERKKALDFAKQLLTTTIAGAAAVTGLATGFALLAKNAGDSKRESKALIGAFTGGRGEEVLGKLDTLSKALGADMEETRGKFVEFRQMRFNNDMSGKLIKMRADLMAVGLSAEAADKEIGYATSAADGFTNLGVIRRLNEIGKAYGGIGSGAAAAARKSETLAGAENKIKNAFNEKMASVWERIGPAIGKAANRLADFAVDLLESEDAKQAIDGIVKGFEAVSDAVNSENLATGLLVLKTAGKTIADVFDFTGKAIAFAASEAVNAVEWISEKFGALLDDFADWSPAGAALVDGLIDGITGAAGRAFDTVSNFASGIADAFAEKLGIHSPSKVFADYGKNTVEGYQQGQEQALASGQMPIQDAASAAPRGRPAAPQMQSGGGGDIIIQEINITGISDAAQIPTAIRLELQRFMQTAQLSRGVA